MSVRERVRETWLSKSFSETRKNARFAKLCCKSLSISLSFASILGELAMKEEQGKRITLHSSSRQINDSDGSE